MHHLLSNEAPNSSKTYEKAIKTSKKTLPEHYTANMNLHIVKHLEVLKNFMKEKRRRGGENVDQKEQSALVEEKKQSTSLEEEPSPDDLPNFELLEAPEEFKLSFQQKYIDFLRFLESEEISQELSHSTFFDKPGKDELKNLDILAKVCYLSGESYYEANSLQLWEHIEACLTSDEKEVVGSVKSFYEQKLFLFEEFSKSKLTKENFSELLQRDLSKLSDPYIVDSPPVFDPAFFEDVMSHQAVLLKGLVNKLGVDPELFTIQNIVNEHANDIIDVVFQNPNLYGFVQNRDISYQYKRQMPIQEYFNYQMKSQALEPQNIKDDDGMIKFAVNIDIEDWPKEMAEIQEKVPKEFLYNSEDDVMIYLKHKIKGVNLPQLYMKVEGAWTGGHEENLRLRAINLNHGPGTSIWYTVGTEYAKDFRKLVQQSYGIDIHKSEGLWFADIDTCLRNGIKVQCFVQEPGDVVILGPGCLHWVRCTGIAVNSAWNFCSKDQFQFEKAFDRDQINKEIDFKSIIPIRHVALELFLKETFKIPESLKLYLAKKIGEFYDEAMEEYQKFQQKYTDCQFIYENEDNAVYNCVNCNQETFNFYVYCDACSRHKKNNEDSILICLQCYEAHLGGCKNTKKITHFYKLSPELVKKFQSQLLKLDSISQEYPNLNLWLSKARRQDKKETQGIEIEKPSSTTKEKTKKVKLSTKLCTRKGKKVPQSEEEEEVKSPSPDRKALKIIKGNQEVTHERVQLDDREYRIRKKLKGEGEAEDLISERSFNNMAQSIRQPQPGPKLIQSDSSNDGFFLGQLLQN